MTMMLDHTPPVRLFDHNRYQARELPLEEWERLRDLPMGQQLPSPEAAAITVVEEVATGKIVATWAAITVTHLEGVWIDPDHRHRPSVVKGLLRGMWDLLRSARVGAVLTITQTPEVDHLAALLGGAEIPGRCWCIPITNSPPSAQQEP